MDMITDSRQADERPGKRRQAMRAAASQAARDGDLETALAHWAGLRAAEPDHPRGYLGALTTLRRAKRLDLAKPIIEEGLARVGGDAAFIAAAAQIALDAHQYAEGDRLWQRAAALAPDNPDYALSAALAGLGKRRTRAERQPVVLQRLREHHAAFPDHAPAYTAHLEILRDMRKLDRAASRAAAWCRRFPGDLDVLLAHVGICEDAGKFGQAVELITAFRAHNPPSVPLEAAYIRALSRAGQHATADSACAAAMTALPPDRRLWLEFARIASRQGDWAGCVDRLRQAQAAFPQDEAIARELRVADMQRAEPETAVAPAAASSPEAAVFNRFESLGGSGMGCEFGMVQKRFDSRAVGLLRWARTNPAEMIAALRSGFAGVGDEDTTEVVVGPGTAGNEQYITRDRRYLMESHTFIRVADAPAAQMFTQTCRRLRFLRDKLLEDLRAGEKIFVYRSEHPISDELIGDMHAALQQFGRNTLLCVMRAQPGHAGGTCRQAAPGLFIGYVSHFALDQAGGTGSDVTNWLAVCTQVLNAHG